MMKALLIILFLATIGIMLLTICTVLWYLAKKKVLIPLGIKFLDLSFEDAYKELKIFRKSIDDKRHLYEVADAENKALIMEQTINSLRAEVNNSSPYSLKEICVWKRNIDEITKIIMDKNQNIEMFFKQRRDNV